MASAMARSLLTAALICGAHALRPSLRASRINGRRAATALAAASSGEVLDGRRFVVCASEVEVAQAVADRVASLSRAAVADKGAFSMSIGSGSTVAPLKDAGVDWAKAHVWFGNERTSGDAAMKCFEGASFLGDLGATLHKCPKDDPDLAAEEYGWDLRAAPEVTQGDGGALPRLDLVLLGSGADGHCASLYPGSPQLDGAGVCAEAEGKGGVTFTPAMISAAKAVVVVAAKPAQAAMVKRALVEPATPDLPAGLFRGADVEWILSTASAAGLLDGSPECVAAIKPEKKEEVAEVEVGSSDYYKGFLETPIDEFDAERDPNGGLDQALKLGGGATVVLGALFLGFMASNGLL